jgi:DNA-binding transcriptional LysR family regulator
MLLRQLEYLTALAHERHFARAAALCNVGQGTLSEGIQRLESDLGVTIVQRGHRFAGFTPEGELVVQWAHRILADRDELHHELASRRLGLSGVLRIGAIPTALPSVSVLTTPFLEHHPLVRISVASNSSREIVQQLGDFEIDAGITYVDGEPLGDVRVLPLYPERYLLLTPAGSDHASRRTIAWADLAGTPLCLLAPEMQNRRILDRHFAAAGVEVVPRIETDTVSVLYAHVASRQWSTVISHAWLHLFGVPEGMHVVPMEDPDRPYHVGLVYADRDPVPMLVQALLDTARVVDMARELDAIGTRHVRTFDR